MHALQNNAIDFLLDLTAALLYTKSGDIRTAARERPKKREGMVAGMKKGKYGICLWFYAMVAFVLAFLGQTLLCGLLLGFVILAERDEWLTKQVIQAFFLTIFSSCVSAVFGILSVFSAIPFLGGIVAGILSFVNGIVSLLVLIFVIIALTHVCREQDANVPFFAGLSNRALGYIARTVYTDGPSGPQA